MHSLRIFLLKIKVSIQMWTFGIYSIVVGICRIHLIHNLCTIIATNAVFDFSSETERNSTKVDRKQDLNVFYQVCLFRSIGKNKMAVPASDWLRYFRLLLWNRWTEINETLHEARYMYQRSLPGLCISGRSKKKNKMAYLASDWLRHFGLLPWNR